MEFRADTRFADEQLAALGEEPTIRLYWVAPIPEFQVKVNVFWPTGSAPGVGLMIDAGAACAMFVKAVAYFGTVPSIPVMLTG